MTMPRSRKWLIGTAVALAVVVVALAIALTWLLYTTSGLRFALDRGVALTDHQFTYASASGTLAGEARVSGLNYLANDGTTLRIDHATLELRPWALLGKRLHIRKARIDGIKLSLEPSKAPNSNNNFSLQPPLTVRLDDTRLTRIAISHAGKPVFAADSLTIAGLWSARRLVLRKLALRAPAGSADLAGTLALARGHRGRGTARIDWSQDGIHYAGTLASQSDGRTATVTATLTAPAPLKLDATLKFDQSDAWTLAVAAPTFNASALPLLPASIKTLSLDLHGAGDARAGKLTGTLAANGHTVRVDSARFTYDGKTLTLDPLRLTSPTMSGVATATGSVRFDPAPANAAFDIAWADVQLPADLVGQALATHGKVRISGNTTQFALQGALAVGPPGRLSDVNIDLAGTPNAIQLHALKLVQKDGGLNAHGQINFDPSVNWQLDATANHFDPGAIFAGWNGSLDFNLATRGSLTPQGPHATVKLDQAGGTLRGRAVAGSKANFAITPDNWLNGSAWLVVGGSRVRIDGKPGTQTDAAIALNVASLNDWLPGATGTLAGKFTAKGSWPKLAIAGDLHGNNLSAGGRRINSLQLSAALPDISQPGGKFDLALRGVEASGLEFSTVDLDGSGSAGAQQATLNAKGKPLSLALDMRGSWQAKTKTWTGTLSGVELVPQGMPAWRQQQPAAIAWRDGTATLARFCVSSGVPELCFSGGRDARGAISGRYTLQHLPLQLLATLASGTNPLQATGDVSGSGQLGIAANGTLSGNASLAASAGSVAFASTANQPLLAWTGITANATASGSNQRVTLHGALTDGGLINGSVGIVGTNHALSGNVSADLRSLAFIGALSPEVANVKGTLAGNLRLGGTLVAPRFAGRVQTHWFSAELPRAGLELRDGDFALTGDPAGRLAISGQITSGTGVLHVDGSSGLAADAPLALSIKGENVLVADIPAAHALASPDLRITRNHGTYDLTGSVAIPSAKVEVEKLPGQGPAQASPDVVIIDAPPAPPVSPLAMNANIEVKLGNAVVVQGYGLDGKVQGQLAVRVRTNQTATGRGQINVSGKYEAYGQNLTIERGHLLFAGTRIDDPGLDIRAVRKIRANDITVGLNIRGTAQRPALTVFSDPAMEQAEALSYLVTGRPLDALKSGEGDTLNTAAQALGGLAGDRIAKSVGSRLGLEAGVSSSEALGGSAFTTGKYLSPRLFLSYGVGLFTPGQVITLRYTLNRFLQFEAENATTSNRASLNYRIEK